MSQPNAPLRPRRLRANLTSEDANRLAALKSARAARIASEAAAAQRRLVTVSVAAGLFLLFAVLALTSVIGAWWLLLPGFFLGGSLVASRQAGRRIEQDEKAELEELASLRSRMAETQIPVRRVQIVEDVDLSEPVEEPEAVVEVEEVAVERRSWKVPEAPAPSHLRKGRISGREIHTDTDIIAVTQIDAARGRPVAATAAAPAAFNLDAVLEIRRAQ